MDAQTIVNRLKRIRSNFRRLAASSEKHAKESRWLQGNAYISGLAHAYREAAEEMDKLLHETEPAL